MLKYKFMIVFVIMATTLSAKDFVLKEIIHTK